MESSKKTEEEKKMDSELLHACNRGQLEKVKELVESGVKVNGLKWHGWEPVGCQGSTALDEAKSIDIMQFLIEHGADVNEPNGEGNTPIVGAVSWLEVDRVRFLIQNGADLNVYEHTVNVEYDLDGGSTGKRSFSRKGSLFYTAFTSTDRSEYDEEWQKKRAEVVKLLLENGVSSNEYLGNSFFLNKAISVNNFYLSELLISKGADVNNGDPTPLHNAIDHQDQNIIRLLLENNARIEKKDIQLAKKKVDKTIYKFLIKTMAELKIKNPDKWWQF